MTMAILRLTISLLGRALLIGRAGDVGPVRALVLGVLVGNVPGGFGLLEVVLAAACTVVEAPEMSRVATL